MGSVQLKFKEEEDSSKEDSLPMKLFQTLCHKEHSEEYFLEFFYQFDFSNN